MSEIGESVHKYIRFSGVDFRQEPIACSHCRWQGVAGQLKVPTDVDLTKAVEYACPRCETVIAVHLGLSDQEVMREMERIRRELAEEMSGPVFGHHSTKSSQPPQVDFDTIRMQIQISEPEEEPADSAAEAELLAGSAISDASVADRKAAPKDDSEDLDFAAIRARISEPA